jgi:alcohol dehydrogenase (cytochrome c)
MKTSRSIKLLWTLFPMMIVASACGAQAPAFTKEQAAAGRTAFRENCAVCHGAKLEGIHLALPLTGTHFDQTWRGKSLAALSFHLLRMPPESVGEPGSLGEETYTNILAFILKSNGLKEGDTALDPTVVAGGRVKIPLLPGTKFDPDAPVAATPAQKDLLANLPTVTDEILQNPAPEDWMAWGRTYDGHSFSPLTTINKDNVKNLTPAWRASLRGGQSMASPIVYQGVMFLFAPPDTVLAMDATNGDVLWRHQYEVKGRSSSKLGISLHGDMVLVPTSDLHVIALNAKTGDLIWDHEIVTEGTAGRGVGYQLRSTPLVIRDKVIQGITGSFASKGGFILAIDINSGEEVWRFNTIARPGEPGGNTWNDLSLDKRSGGSVWHQGTYDPELDLLYYGIAPTYDTGPLMKPIGKEGITNDALFTNCTIALDPDTGDLVWHYQHLANDQWDLDWAFERQIVNVPVNGKMRKAVINVGKIAILEALDAATGEYLFSIDSGTQNIIAAIDPKTGTKTFDPDTIPDPERPCIVCPNAAGARSWPPTSYSPETKLSYIPIMEWCMEMGDKGMKLLTSGVGISGAEHPDTQDGMLARVQALDVANQKPAWNYDQLAPISTGLLSTAGGLVFSGDVEPSLKALDADTGELLWQAKLDNSPSAGLMTYSVAGKQYVAVVVGIGNIHVGALEGSYRTFAAKQGIKIPRKPGGGSTVWVFALEETVE